MSTPIVSPPIVSPPIVSPPIVSPPIVSLVIPALNEQRNLEELLPRLPGDVDELIVIDGHSTDETVSVTRRLCPDAIVLAQPGVGKGDALAAGFAAATGSFVVMMDADGSNDPHEIPVFVAALRRGAGFAKGSRFVPGGGSADITAVRAFGNRFLRRAVNLLYGTRYTDLCYGFNAFRAEALRSLDVHCEGFEVEALISCQMARARVVVEEVPSFERPRVHGASNLRPLRDGLRILGIIVRERLRMTTVSAQETAIARRTLVEDRPTCVSATAELPYMSSQKDDSVSST